jgi:CRP-like cAMP-binding protein
MENAKIAASMARVKAEAAAKLEAVKAAAEKAAAEKAAAENQATSISVINTSSQTRLTMDNISRTFDKLSIVQEKYDSLLKKSKKNASETKKVETIIDAAVNIVGDAIFDDALDEAALSLPNTGEKEKVIDRDTLRKRKQIKVFLNKVKLDAAHDFNDKDIEDMVSLLDIHGVAPGDDIITQGEKATWLGMLLSGELDVIVNGVGKVATMKAGALLGEISFLGGSLERTASVKTKISGIVAAIPFRRIVELQDTDAGLYRKLMLLIAEAGIVKLFSAESRLKGQIAALKTQLSGLNARDESNVKKVEEKKVEQKENSSHSDTDSDYGSESGSHSSDRGSDLSSLEYHPGKHKRRKKKRGSILGQKRKKKSHKFLLSSNNEVFYRTKVAQAEKNLEEMQHELDKEEREMKRLRAKVKGEELQRKHLEKEMEFMQMKLAAAGLLD